MSDTVIETRPHWCDHELHRHAPKGGEVDALNGKFYRGGEFEQFFVPRPVMPQVDEKYYPELFDFAEQRGVLVKQVVINPPELLIPHQHIDKLKSKHMDASPEVMAKPILISVDKYILDGNHRWLAHVLEKMGVNAYQFHLPFEQAIAFLFDFPYTYSYGDGKVHPISA